MKKFIISFITVSLLAFGTISPICAKEINLKTITENDEIVTFDGNYIKAIQNEDKIEITDKRTGEKITILTRDNKPYAIIDNDNNIINIQPLAKAPKMGVEIPPGIDPSKFSYTYVNTVRVNQKLNGSIKNITLSILGLIPWIGPVFGIAAVIDEILSLGKDTVYIEYDYYYAKGYQYYKYVTRFYSDSKYKNLIDTSVDYVKMW